MDRMLTFAKAVAAGAPTTITKAQFFEEMDRRAQADRKPGESVAQAFADSPRPTIGKVLLQARTDWRRVLITCSSGPRHDGRYGADAASISSRPLAADHQKTTGVTPEAAFAAVYTDPANKDVVAQHKAELAEQSAIDAARHWPGVAQTFRAPGAPEHSARVS